MATGSVACARVGYTAGASSSAGAQLSTSTSDAYVSVAGNKRAGIVEYKRSINSILGTSATKFSELVFQSVIIQIRTRDSMNVANNWHCAVSNTLLQRGNNISGMPGYSAGYTINIGTNTQTNLDITNIFNSIPDSSPFTPATSTWYFYITHNSVNSTRRFWRRDRWPWKITFTTLDIPSGYRRCAAYYYDGSSWKAVEPKVYTGTSFENRMILYKT